MEPTDYDKLSRDTARLARRLHDDAHPPWRRIVTVPRTLSGDEHRGGNLFGLALHELAQGGDGRCGVWDRADAWKRAGHETPGVDRAARVVVWREEPSDKTLRWQVVPVWRHSDVSPAFGHVDTLAEMPRQELLDDWMARSQAPISTLGSRPGLDMTRQRVVIPHVEATTMDVVAHNASAFAALMRWAAHAWADTPYNRLVASMGAVILATRCGMSAKLNHEHNLSAEEFAVAVHEPRAMYQAAGRAWKGVEDLEHLAGPIDELAVGPASPRLSLRL